MLTKNECAFGKYQKNCKYCMLLIMVSVLKLIVMAVCNMETFQTHLIAPENIQS